MTTSNSSRNCDNHAHKHAVAHNNTRMRTQTLAPTVDYFITVIYYTCMAYVIDKYWHDYKKKKLWKQ